MPIRSSPSCPTRPDRHSACQCVYIHPKPVFVTAPLHLPISDTLITVFTALPAYHTIHTKPHGGRGDTAENPSNKNIDIFFADHHPY